MRGKCTNFMAHKIDAKNQSYEIFIRLILCVNPYELSSDFSKITRTQLFYPYELSSDFSKITRTKLSPKDPIFQTIRLIFSKNNSYYTSYLVVFVYHGDP